MMAFNMLNISKGINYSEPRLNYIYTADTGVEKEDSRAADWLD